MSAEYTVPALRDQAAKLRKDADDMIARAQVEAEKYRVAANEIDALADSLKNGAVIPEAVPCRSCGHPLVRDELGWRHADQQTGNECPGTTPPVPAPPTAPFDAVPAGEVAGNA